MNVRTPPFLGATLLGLCAACASATPVARNAAPEYDPAPAYPHWAGRPVTWSKLGDIETWLEGDGPEQYPGYEVRAELELAEGRLFLAQKEGADGGTAGLTARLRAAEAGFKTVLARADATPALRQRAELGLERIGELRGGQLARAEARPGAESPPASLAIQPRAAWTTTGPLRHRLTAAGGWNRITVHHSAKYSKEIGTPTSGNVAGAIQDIQTVHMRDRGWGDIGYHFLIDPTGRIWQGRSLEWQGAHAQGANNVANIGVCLLGDFSHERPDPRALESLERLVDALCERHHIARDRVYGHQRFASTECPGAALMAWVSRYAAGATH